MRVGLIADGQRLHALAPALAECLMLQPIAQAGMPQPQAMPEMPWFDDPRLVLGQPNIEAVLLATSTRRDVELAAQVTERGLHLWCLPPLARDFAEATEVVSRYRRGSTICRVASWWEYVADHVWNELPWPEDFEPLFSDVRLTAPRPEGESWQARPVEAAGGVLANDAYFLLEALVAVRGLPESVSAAVGNYRDSVRGGPRETEDTAVAILRYGGGTTAAVHAMWDPAPSRRRIVHYGRTASVTLNDEEVALLDGNGQPLDRRPLPGEFLANELLRFAESVRGSARDRAAAPLERHLAVSALLEAIYLAARTNHPESPGKFYQVQGWPEPRS